MRTTQLSRILVAILCAFIAATTLAQKSDPTDHKPTFDVATVRAHPNGDFDQNHFSRPGIGRFEASNVTLELLLMFAYDIDGKLILNRPSWLGTNLYDVNAKPEAGITLTREELQPRLQALLQQRFHLVAHRETRETSGYALVVDRHGALLKPTKGEHFPGYRIQVSPGKLKGINWSMRFLANVLTPFAGKPVIDQTGLSDSYDIDVEYAPDVSIDSTLPSLFTALEEKLGLRLVARKIPVEFLVIDSVDPTPAPN